jgi:hypothetical protein
VIFPRAALLGVAFGAALGLGAVLASSGQNPPAKAGTSDPPELGEIRKAERIAEPGARLRELLRIKTAYPRSGQSARLDSDVLEARIDLASGVPAILELQKSAAGQGRGTARLTSLVQAAARILDHPGLSAFDRSQVLAAVQGYRSRAEKIASDPETLAGMPDPEDRKAAAAAVSRDFDLLSARALANAGDGAGAVASLERYRAAGGEAGPDYFSALGDAYAALGRIEDAYGLFLGAAVDRYPGAADKAKAAYLKTHGTAAGFDDRLDELSEALPFQPDPFAAPKRWRGKTVLAEAFTDTENALCLASDLAVAGLIDTYPARYLAILTYHVSGRGTDPLANDAGRERRDEYRLPAVPALVVDGDVKVFGGGTRRMAEAIFKRYKATIDPRIGWEPDLKLRAEAKRAGDRIEVEVAHNRDLPGTEHFVALVRVRERWKGASGTLIHHLHVLELKRIDPAKDKQVVFERSQEARDRLQAVYFVQDLASRQIMNVAVADAR